METAGSPGGDPRVRVSGEIFTRRTVREKRHSSRVFQRVSPIYVPRGFAIRDAKGAESWGEGRRSIRRKISVVRGPGDLRLGSLCAAKSADSNRKKGFIICRIQRAQSPITCQKTEKNSDGVDFFVEPSAERAEARLLIELPWKYFFPAVQRIERYCQILERKKLLLLQ